MADPTLHYTTTDDLRAAADETGAALNPAKYSDDALLVSLALAEKIIEKMTKQWFWSRPATVQLDGTDSDTLHLSVPIVSVEQLFTNNSPEALATNLYEVYSGKNDLVDDRANPRIKLLTQYQKADLYTDPIAFGVLKFRKGRRNQKIVGHFGYVEEDGTTPLMIVRAVHLLALEKMGALVLGGKPGPPPSPFRQPGPVQEEATDGHRIRYAITPRAARKIGLSGLTQNPEVEDIALLYRAPRFMAAPASWSWES